MLGGLFSIFPIEMVISGSVGLLLGIHRAELQCWE